MKNYKLDTKKIISTLVAAGVLASGTAVFAEYYPEKTADPNLDYTTTIQQLTVKRLTTVLSQKLHTTELPFLLFLL